MGVETRISIRLTGHRAFTFAVFLLRDFCLSVIAQQDFHHGKGKGFFVSKNHE